MRAAHRRVCYSPCACLGPSPSLSALSVLVCCAQLRFDKGDTIELISSTRTNALLEGDPYLHGQLIISPKNETWLNKLGECFLPPSLALGLPLSDCVLT